MGIEDVNVCVCICSGLLASHHLARWIDRQREARLPRHAVRSASSSSRSPLSIAPTIPCPVQRLLKVLRAQLRHRLSFQRPLTNHRLRARRLIRRWSRSRCGLLGEGTVETGGGERRDIVGGVEEGGSRGGGVERVCVGCEGLV
jgi:hypothetical protein